MQINYTKICFTALLLMCFTLIKAQQDSIEDKLQQYKYLYLKGFITQQQYDSIKLKTPGLNPKNNTPHSALPDKRHTGPPYFTQLQQPEPERPGKKVLLNVRIVPVAFFDVASITISHWKDGTGPYYKSVGQNYIYGGAHVEIGPAINKIFHPNLSAGVEAGNHRLLFPVYADLNVNTTKSKYSPFVHAGVGYLNMLINTPYYESISMNGLLLNAGAGINISFKEVFSLAAAFDYRLNITPYSTAIQGVPITDLISVLYLHQLGVRLLFTFYGN